MIKSIEWLIFTLILPCLFPTLLLAQSPSIVAKGLANQSFISTKKDSVYIKGLENVLMLSFPGSKDSIYYQLLGLDAQTQKSEFPIIRYTNLAGGHYMLNYRLASQNKNRFLSIHIEEAIWQKWWFFPVLALNILLLILIVIYQFFLFNFRQKMKIQLLRNKISADLHDEVGSNLSSIAIYTKVLRKQITDPKILPLLDKISNNSKESVILMQDTIWALNPNNDSPERLLIRIETYAKEILSQKNISYFQDKSEVLNLIKLDMENRKNLYFILKEGVNNIAKHSNATKAALNIEELPRKILFTLSDNGDGFDPNTKVEGNGLRNFRERAFESNFEFTISSEIHKGTKLMLAIYH